MKKILLVLTLCSVFVLSSANLAVGQIPPIYPIPPFIEKAIFEKWLELKELSAAPSHSSGYGKVYVLASDGHLYYKDDSGSATDITAGALGGTTTTVEEGDVAVNGSDIVTIDFLAADFIVGEDPNTEVNIAIDYANGQEATTSQTGFLNDTDWDIFNNKQAGHALLTSFAAQTYVSGSYSAITGASTVSIRTYAQVLSDIGGQASDAGLTSLAGLTYASDSFIKVTATDTYAIRTLAETAGDLEAEIEADIDTLANLTSIQGQTFTLAGNFVTQNNNVTINAVDAARTFTLTENFTIGGGSAGTLTFSAGSKTLTVADNCTVNQNLQTTDDPTFDDLVVDKIEAKECFTFDAVQTATGDGTTTVDWGLGNVMYFTFGAQNDTFTFTAPPGAAKLTLVLKQDGGGSRLATWPGTVLWPGNVAPTLSTGAADVDIVSLLWDGTNYFGVFNGNFE